MADSGEEPPAKRPKTKRSARTKGLMCYAINCQSYRNKVFSDEGISFHTFPNEEKQPELYAMWVRNCLRNKKPAHCSRICSKHFDPRLMNRTLERRFLKENAVPTLFDVPDSLLHESPLQLKSEHTLHAQEIDLAEDDDAPQEVELAEDVLPPEIEIVEDEVVLQELVDDVEEDDEASILPPSPPPPPSKELDTTGHPYKLPEGYPMQKLVVELHKANVDLRKELQSAKIEERRAKNTIKSLVQQLVAKNVRNTELELKLASYEADIP